MGNPKSPQGAIIAQNQAIIAPDMQMVDVAALFERISIIIENRKYRAQAQANCEATLMFWEVGQFINSVVLENKRAAYGKKILTTLSSKLSWSHFMELLPLPSDEARLYYANDASKRNYGVRELRRQISRKAYERREIANTSLSEQSIVPFNVFKDPYLLDILGLRDNYLEADLEKAILVDIEAFLLEFGRGFSFVERQKRMIIDGEDVCLDLLFFNRILKRLVAVELKLGRFKAA
jgi:predicted nuclease of restriction endonuclease-like (RecB) superfamily